MHPWIFFALFAAAEPAEGGVDTTCRTKIPVVSPGKLGLQPVVCESRANTAGVTSAMIGQAVVSGIANFVSSRARQEVVQWFLDSMSHELCSSKHQLNEYFPETCRLAVLAETSGMPSRTALVASLRRDARVVIGKLFDTALGPRAAEFRELLTELFDGVVRVRLPFEWLAGIAAQPPGGAIHQRCVGATAADYQGRQFACSVLAIGVVVDVYMKVQQGQTNVAGATIERAAREKFVEGLRTTMVTYKGVFGQLGWASNDDKTRQLYDALFTRQGEWSKIDGMYQGLVLRGPTTEQLLQANTRALQFTVDLMTDVLSAYAGPPDPGSIAGTLSAVWQPAVAVFSALSSGDVESALRELPRLMAVFPEGKLGKLPPSLVRYLPVIIDLASAKSADDVQSALEAAASPVGGWRAKRLRQVTSIGAVVGLDVSAEWGLQKGLLQSSGLGVGLFAPVGVDVAWPYKKSSLGLFLSVINVGGLVDYQFTSSTVDTSETAVATPKPGFAQVFAPGAFFRAGLGRTPLSFITGVSWSPAVRELLAGPDESRTVNALRISVGFGVDVTIVPFGRHRRRR